MADSSWPMARFTQSANCEPLVVASHRLSAISHRHNNLEMKYNLAHLEFPHYPLLLAPMEDVSDPPFRYVCKMFGADVVRDILHWG